MKILRIAALLALCHLPIHAFSQQAPAEKGMQAITTDAVRAQLGFLASNWTEGREAGEKGEYIAGDYIASMLQLYGVKPAGDVNRSARGQSVAAGERSYFQNFVLIRTVPGKEQKMKLSRQENGSEKSIEFAYNVDFYSRSFGQSVEIDAPVVFAGYGLVSNKLNYNDIARIDLKGKFVLRISGTPKNVLQSLSVADFTELSRESEAALRAAGAAGILEVNPSVSTAGIAPAREFLNMSPAENPPGMSRSGASYSLPGRAAAEIFPRIQVSVRTANEILKGTGIDIDSYIKSAEAGAPMQLRQPDGSRIYIKSTVESIQVRVRNILGVIEGNSSDQVLVLGAHYDHLGMSDGYLWNGADDNGSGTVGIMTIAKALCATGAKPQKTILIALWTAEEEGLLGSKYWLQNPTIPAGSIGFNLNFDMISRYINEKDTKKVTMTYTETYPVFKDITAKNLKKFKIDLDVDYQPSADPPGGSDHRNFTAAGIPVMRFKPGHREEYHTPGDDTGTVDWDIMEKIIRIGYANVWELANSEWK